MKINTLKITTLFFLLLLSFAGMSQVTLPPFFNCNMVLQKGIDIPVWGWASPGEKVTVTFEKNTVSTHAGKNGKWRVNLPKMEYGGPYRMTVKGKNFRTIENIMIGEVWVCSGQSNMEFKVSQTKNAADEIKAANYPDIRFFTVKKKVAQKPLENLEEGEWWVCSPQSVSELSAVGYFFGRNLYEHLKVPIGLIHTSWGGTVAETWTSKETIENDPDFNISLKELTGMDFAKYKEQKMATLKKLLKEIPTKDQGLVDGVAVFADPKLNDADWAEISPAKVWEESGYESIDGIAWYRKTIELTSVQAKNGSEISLGAIDDNDISWINGVKIGATNKYDTKRIYAIPANTLKAGKNVIAIRVEDTGGGGGLYGGAEDKYLQIGDKKLSLSDPWKFKVTEARIESNDVNPNDYPTLLYNGMINPIVPYGIRGAIWYQGESNASRAQQYKRVFPNLIKDWRTKWNQGNFPFLFVQLANYMKPVAEPTESEWAELREAQTQTLGVENTGMATIIDVGDADNIHPTDKQTVGYRLSLAARKVAYGETLVYTGPTYKEMKIDKNKIYITFDNVGKGLKVNNKYGYINGFTVASKDGNFKWAKATILNENTVVVTSEAVDNPAEVRYGWANNPDDVNLYNVEGLPANPFRTDLRQGITK